MFVTGDQILLHLIGDYILQSHWMATEKVKRSTAALAHAILYMLPFLLLTQSPAALGVIAASHFVIDRWRLARFVCWLKNWVGVPSYPEDLANNDLIWHNKRWSACSNTGYPDDVPAWLSVWLLIAADNTVHLLCNAAAIRWL